MIAIHLDFETYGTLDLRKVGAYRYAQDEHTEVLIACYAVDNGPVRTWLPWQRKALPEALRTALEAGATIFAHNAEFERQIWQGPLGNPYRVPIARWKCTAAVAAGAGLPRRLEDATRVLGCRQTKDPRGAKLIRIFCQPRKPTKKNPATRILPTDAPADFQEFIEYCAQDVRAERELHRLLPDLPPQEWKNFWFNTLINDRGLPLAVEEIRQTISVVHKIERANIALVDAHTGGIRPTQRDKLLAWLNAQCLAEGVPQLKNLQLKTIVKHLAKPQVNGAVREVLETRLEASKASTKKLAAMLTVVCKDGHAHGTMLYHGAHTGRIAGKLIQPHNFTRGLLSPEQMDCVIRVFASGDPEYVQMMFAPQPMDRLAQSMRGYIKAPDGQRFVIADYNAIETRVLAWWAKELKLLKAYADNLRLPPEKRIDVYKTMAVVLYNVAYQDVTKEQRRIGKNLRLGAGYQLGVEGLLSNCAKEEIEMTREFAEQAIAAYRQDNRNIVRLWYTTEEAMLHVMTGGRPVAVNGLVQYERWRDWLLLCLPSGRAMYYFQPQLETVEKWGKIKQQLSYLGRDNLRSASYGSQNKGAFGKLGRVRTYGGKLVENAVQAMARDVLMHGMLRAEDHGYTVKGSVHDEIITQMPIGKGDYHDLERVICILPKWATGLPLMAEGFESVRYRKG